MTICDPMDGNMPGSLFFTISQSLLNFISIEPVMPSTHLILHRPDLLLPSIFSVSEVKVLTVQLCPTLCDPMNTRLLCPWNSRQEYWSRLPFPSPGDLPDPGIETRSSILQADTSTSEPPGKTRVFTNESVLHIRCPKDWNFSFSISPSNEYLGLISFRIDWFDLLAVQRTLKSLLQYHSLKEFFRAQSYLWSNSHIYT